ncbi:VOC family protein [Algisphaera agarilytica]|uniref:Glyoxylase I family protein n=1 Tax=Algisphaera agarilytica TaxID=1385975 RepID=A0A7X0H706_9BACT|nr:VOC family protein [Algisphaera agarilytica]MBB6430399.1 glyoxylase I family protein [Algisphaera agarilytica]
MSHTNPYLRGGGIHHVALRTPDFDRSVAFYTQTLGASPKMQWLMDGDTRAVMLDIGDGNYVEVFERGEDDPASPDEARLLHFCLRCDNLDEVVERVRQAGMTITVEPNDVPIENQAEAGPAAVTLRLAFFKGPDGETVELMQCEDL